jgi:hypothetical protein
MTHPEVGGDTGEQGTDEAEEMARAEMAEVEELLDREVPHDVTDRELEELDGHAAP